MKRMKMESDIENMLLYIMKTYLSKYVVAVFLIFISNLTSAQQFEIRYGDSVLNNGDYIFHIPTEEEIQQDYFGIQLEICNISDEEGVYSIHIEGNQGTQFCMVVFGVFWEVTLPWTSPGRRIYSNNCFPVGISCYPSYLTYTECYSVTIWDTCDISSYKTIYVIPYDTTLHPFPDIPQFDPTLFFGIPPTLCMVTVQDGYNKLIWNKDDEISTYNIFRESVVAGEYEQVATIPFDSASVWIDTTSRANTRSYRYKINATTLMGNDFPLGPEHKTMHLTINQGLGGRWNLQWTPYEGAEYTTYIIYRGTTADSLEQIDIMPADGNTSYTDETATEGDVFYQVGIVMANDCASMENKSASISLSNIATNSSIQSIYNIEADGISIYSEGGRIMVEGTTDEVRVFDMVGRNVRNEALPAGVYMVRIGNYPARKVVVIR